MAEPNIQSLFMQLRLEQFLAYLPSNGWCEASEPRADRVRFELSEGANPYVLVLPSSSTTPKCRTYLQKAVYNLCGVEDRQPIEIVRDLLATEAETDAATGPSATSVAPPVRLRFRNDNNAEMVIQIASRSAANSLMPGEAMEILYHRSDGDSIEIGFQGSTIQIDDRAAQ